MSQRLETSVISKTCSLIKLLLSLEKYHGIHLTDVLTFLNIPKDLTPEDTYSLRWRSGSQQFLPDAVSTYKIFFYRPPQHGIKVNI